MPSICAEPLPILLITPPGAPAPAGFAHPYERIDEGSAPRASDGPRLEPAYPLPLTAAETIRLAAHRDAWERIAKSETPGGLVIEAEARIGEGFAEALALATSEARAGSAAQIIRFSTLNQESDAATRRLAGGLRLFRPEVVAPGAEVQIISREAARCLLKASAGFSHPAPVLLSMPWAIGCEVLALRPSGIAPANAQSRPMIERLRLWLFHLRRARRARLAILRAAISPRISPSAGR